MFVEEIMNEPVHCVTQDDCVGLCRDIFQRVHYHHLIVTEGEQVIGVVSDRDVLANLSPYVDSQLASEQDQALLNKTVRDIMSTNIISVRRDSLIDTASILLLENTISCLPVVAENNRLEGIVTWKDMLKYYVYAG